MNKFTGDFSSTDHPLLAGNGLQCVVVNRLHEAVSQSVQGHAESSNEFSMGKTLLRFGTHRSVVDEGAVRDIGLAVVDEDGGIHEVTRMVQVTGAEF